MAPTKRTYEQRQLDREQRYCTEARCLTTCKYGFLTRFGRILYNPWFYMTVIVLAAYVVNVPHLPDNGYLALAMIASCFGLLTLSTQSAMMIISCSCVLVVDAWHNRHVIRAYFRRMHYAAVHDTVTALSNAADDHWLVKKE